MPPSSLLAPPIPLSARLAAALETVEGDLLAQREASGAWRGNLSASALSTATASFTILLALRDDSAGDLSPARSTSLLRRGLAWLATHANDDGGWGDTIASRSNLSTTLLCWATLAAATDTEGAGSHRNTLDRAQHWIEARAGSLDPQVLARAVEDLYGEDRTFSVPILTLVALAGQLGPKEAAFRRMPAFPFELAALPQGTFSLLGLPVVSYALPALIAVGQVQHHHAASAFPPLAGLRQRLRPTTLRRLESIQPPSGGFLEAAPLTSFVAMSLLGAGAGDHPVVRRCLRFLDDTVAKDGSWRIEVDLATWLTTLAVQGLSVPAPQASPLSAEDREAIRAWLLGQQWTQQHPFTGSKPGGWAWTDLSGGVPDADDTAGALLALRTLGEMDPGTRNAAEAGLSWLLELQNRDGGIPTFCKGWGKLPFDRSAPDLTAHALRSWVAWRPEVDSSLGRRIDRGIAKALAYLHRTRCPDGSWLPLWFGNEQMEDFTNPTFGTARVVRALGSIGDLSPAARGDLEAGRQWLIQAQNSDGGWGGAPGIPSSVEETALALDALATGPQTSQALEATLRRGGEFLCDRIEADAAHHPTPIGFYFANLWYFEQLYPLIFSVTALRRLLQRLA